MLAGGDANGVAPGLMSTEGVLVGKVRAAAKALGQAECPEADGQTSVSSEPCNPSHDYDYITNITLTTQGPAEKEDASGADLRTQDTEVDAARLLIRPLRV